MAAELELLDGGDATAEGRVIVRKVAASDDERERFAHEALMLQRASHPGVVEFVSFDEATATLRTQFAGDQTWQSTPPATLSELAKGIASVASTLSDLHEIAVTHGAVAPDHIIVGPGSRPILCDLSQSGDQDPAIDVAALGEVLLTCLETIADGKASTRKGLSALAVRATATTSSRRPSAGALATAARQLVDTPDSATKAQRRPNRAVVSGTAVLAAAVAILFWPSGEQPLTIATLDDALAASPSTAANEPAPTTSLDTPTPTTTTPTTDAPTATTQPPLVIDYEGFQYAVGRSGDSATVGDWDCNGAETAAVLRPHSGEVYLFQDWPGQAETAQVTPLTIPNSTARLETGSECGHLVLVDAAGDSVTLKVEHTTVKASS